MHNKTRANFHEPKKPKIRQAIAVKNDTTFFVTCSPIPISIYSNCDCILEENSKMFMESNHACSCDKIKVKYFFLKLRKHLVEMSPKKK